MTRFTVDSEGVAEDDHPTAVDFLGQRYGVGDHVVYATTSGRSPVLKLGLVHVVESFPTTRYDWDRHDRVPDVGYKIGLQWLESGRGWSKPSPTTNGKPRLSYPSYENIVKVSHG